MRGGLLEEMRGVLHLVRYQPYANCQKSREGWRKEPFRGAGRRICGITVSEGKICSLWHARVFGDVGCAECKRRGYASLISRIRVAGDTALAKIRRLALNEGHN